MFPSEIPAMTTDALGSEICSLGAHIAAATCRWLLLIGEFDRRSGAGDWECRSTAHWLNWRCGVSMNTAREYVRVGVALAELPATAAAFGRGELSYSKVRAITRIARPENEADLVYRTAIAALFDDGVPAVELVRQKDMLFGLEEGVDQCEDAMDVIRSVVVKNG